MNRKITGIILLTLLVFIKGNIIHAQTRVSIVGINIDSVSLTGEHRVNPYGVQLQQLLGKHYRVKIFASGESGIPLKTDRTAGNRGLYREALQSNPEIVFIEVGANAGILQVGAWGNQFKNRCTSLVQAFQSLPSRPRIAFLLPLSGEGDAKKSPWSRVIQTQIIPQLQEIAFEQKTELLTIPSLLTDKSLLLPNLVQPNPEGTLVVAKRLKEFILELRDTTFNVLSALQRPVTISSFNGYSCANMEFNGSNAKIVQPKWTAKGRPWVWRARFWGHEPQADIALLERGFHIVYCDVAELFGNDEAIDRWNRFYALLKAAGLSQKAVMEGMSRGGVYVFNWAAVNPDKVACVYVDNPVLDLKSWPGGQGKVPAPRKELDALKNAYNLQTDADIRNFKGSPVYKVKEIVAGGYPILILCADADKTVLPEENTYLFEQRIRELKGNITVIHKPGFDHHPHSLPDPTRIVDFVLQNSINKKL